jgi:lipid-A-disaccharide synthase
MARHVDQVLCLLPFEPPYMEAAGMRADFTGHPVVAEPIATEAEVQAFRQAEGLGDAPVLLVLPGSRRGEVGRLMPVFGEALRTVSAARPDLRVVLPAAAGVAEAVTVGAANWPGQPLVLDPRGQPRDTGAARKRAAFAAAGLALAASGTVSLELAAAATPMVIAYDMNWLSWQIMSRMARLDTVTLVNIIVGRNLVPECLGPACRPAPIAAALLALLDDPSARAAQAEAMEATMLALGRGGEPPGPRAARAVLDGLAGGNKPGVLSGS